MLNIPIEVWATIIGLIGAAIGYTIREYRNRTVPFFQIVNIQTTAKASDREFVDKDTTEKLKDSFYIKPIENSTTLREVFSRYDRAEDVEKYWPQAKQRIETVLAARDHEAYVEALSRIFGLRFPEIWMIDLLVSSRIRVMDTPPESKELIAVYDSDEHEGSVYFGFPNEVKNFGVRFKEEWRKKKCEPLIKSVSTLHREGLKDFFEQFIKVMEKEYTIAVSTIGVLKTLYDNHSRWTFVVYFANLSNNPLIIMKETLVEIVDRRSKARFLVPWELQCELIAVKREGHYYEYDETHNPIVIEAGSGEEFGFITSKTQGEMEDKTGYMLREVFDSGKGVCRVKFLIHKVGLFKRQEIKSEYTQFISSGKAPLS